MTIYDVDRLPLGSTRTLSSDTDQITIRKSYIAASNFSKAIAITNIDDAEYLYISFWN